MLNEVIRRYRRFNPETGAFDVERTIREYGRVIGVNSGQLTQIINDVQRPGLTVLSRIMETFPPSRKDILDAMAGLTPAIEPEKVPA